MKKIILLLLFVPFIGFAQTIDSIKMTRTSFTPAIIELQGKSNNEIYSKIKSWINRYYKNPDFVIKADETNNYIRISSTSTFEFYQMGLARNNYNYDLEIEIKENKYKITFFNIIDTSINNAKFPNYFFKKNGELYGFKKVNISVQKGIIKSLNEIHFELYNFINSNKNEW
jgi:hypothetical protein